MDVASPAQLPRGDRLHPCDACDQLWGWRRPDRVGSKWTRLSPRFGSSLSANPGWVARRLSANPGRVALSYGRPAPNLMFNSLEISDSDSSSNLNRAIAVPCQAVLSS